MEIPADYRALLRTLDRHVADLKEDLAAGEFDDVTHVAREIEATAKEIRLLADLEPGG